MHVGKAMGKMRNCGVRNAEGKMRNGMCGTTVIGRAVTPHNCIYSAFHHMPCITCVEVKCMRKKLPFAQCMQLFDAGFWIMLMNVENNNHLFITLLFISSLRVSPLDRANYYRPDGHN